MTVHCDFSVLIILTVFSLKWLINFIRKSCFFLPERKTNWTTQGSKRRSVTCELYFNTAFQTEIYAILQCAYENIRRAYKNKRILIFSDSQAALRALSGPKVISRLVEECQEALSALATLNEVTLVWVPGHHGILGNEMADKLARQASAMPLLGPEPLLEYLSVWQERQSRAGLTINTQTPRKLFQAADMASFLKADHVRKELMTCLK